MALIFRRHPIDLIAKLIDDSHLRMMIENIKVLFFRDFIKVCIYLISIAYCKIVIQTVAIAEASDVTGIYRAVAFDITIPVSIVNPDPHIRIPIVGHIRNRIPRRAGGIQILHPEYGPDNLPALYLIFEKRPFCLFKILYVRVFVDGWMKGMGQGVMFDFVPFQCFNGILPSPPYQRPRKARHHIVAADHPMLFKDGGSFDDPVNPVGIDIIFSVKTDKNLCHITTHLNTP